MSRNCWTLLPRNACKHHEEMLLIQKVTIARPQVVNLSELQHVTILEFSQRRHFSYQKIIIIVNTLWLMYNLLTERQGKNQKEH